MQNAKVADPLSTLDSTSDIFQTTTTASSVVVVENDLLEQLLAQGVHRKDTGKGATRKAGAETLVRTCPRTCRQWMEWFPDLLAQMEENGETIRSRPALLVECIRNQWPMPERTRLRLEAAEKAQKAQAAQEASERANASQKAAERDRRASEEDEARHLDAAWEALDVQTRQRLDAQARQRLGILGAAGRAPAAQQAMRRTLLREHLQKGSNREQEVHDETPIHATG
jgi:hypothetical protein